LTGALLAALVAAAAPHPCSTDQLRLVYHGGQGAAGTFYEAFRLAPKPGVRCRLGGYPGIALLDSRGHKVVHVGRFHDDLHPVKTLTFTHRRPARFVIRHPGASPKTGKPCRRRIVSIEVIPPNERDFLTVNFRRPLLYCSAGAQVSPVGRHY
jgi:hypothetical protein